MPIRFRCAYCTQLMSIARRKAGSVVRCPKCAGEIIVPVPEGGGGIASENENFDVQLEPGFDANAPSATVAGAGPPPIVDAPMPMPPTARLGFFMPIGMLIVSGIVIVLLLILVFVIGLIIGRQSGPAG